MSLIGTLAVNVIANVEKFSRDIAGAQSTVSYFVNTVSFEMGRFTSIISDGVTAADALSDSATKLGISASSLQAWSAVAEGAGGSAQSMEMALSKLNTVLGEIRLGSTEAADGFNKLGLDPIRISAMSTSEAFQEIADKISSMPDQADRAAAAFEIFGKSGAELLPVLQASGDEILNMMNSSEELGQVINDSLIEKAGELHDAFARVTTAGTNFAITIAGALSSTLAPVLDAIAAKLGSYIRDLSLLAERLGLVTLSTDLKSDEDFSAERASRKAAEEATAQKLAAKKEAKEEAEWQRKLSTEIERSAKEAARQQEAMREEAEKLSDALRTPEQIYDAQVKNLEKMRDLSLITADTYSRGVRKYADELQHAQEEQRKLMEQPIGSKGLGSVGAFSSIAEALNNANGFGRGGESVDTKATAKNTGETVKRLDTATDILGRIEAKPTFTVKEVRL